MGPDWLRQTLNTGMIITAVVGLAVGAVVTVTAPAKEVPSAGRLVILPLFIGMTALWAFPMAFFIRWLSIRSIRRVMRPVPTPLSTS
jgi:hypothetical protein